MAKVANSPIVKNAVIGTADVVVSREINKLVDTRNKYIVNRGIEYNKVRNFEKA
jgi:hypothetical protein